MYTTQTNVESKLGTAFTEEQANYFNSVLNPAITALIDSETNAQFASNDSIAVYVSGNDSTDLVIPTMNSITSVSSVDNQDTPTVITSLSYQTYPRGKDDKYSIIKNNGTWDKGVENYIVTGKLGYKNIPNEIIEVATELAVNTLDASSNDYKSEKVGDWSVTYSDAVEGMSMQSKEALARYKRLSRRI